MHKDQSRQERQSSSSLWQSPEEAARHAEVMQRAESIFGDATRQMVEAAGLREGFHVLDLAAGTGGQSLPVARAVGLTGSVLVTDISAAMLDLARLLAQQEGLTNITTQVMNAEQLELPDQCFDAVICRLALNLFNLDKALPEILRVLKPQRRLAALVWSTAERHPLWSIRQTLMLKYVTLPPLTAGPFSLGGPGVFEHALSQSGFTAISVEPVPIEFRFSSMEAFLQQPLDPYLNSGWERLSQQEQQLYLQDVQQAMHQFEGPQGLVVPAELLLGVGTK